MGTVYSVSAVDAATDKLTITAHGRANGDGPACVFVPNGDAPGGLTEMQDIWLIVVDADHVKVATSSANALAGTAIDITSTGSGAIKLLYGIPYRRATTYAASTQVKSADMNAMEDALPTTHGPWVHGAPSWVGISGATITVPVDNTALAGVAFGVTGSSAYCPLPEAVPGLKIGSVECYVKQTAASNIEVRLMRQKYDGSVNAEQIATGNADNGPFSVVANHIVAAGYVYWLIAYKTGGGATSLIEATVLPG